MTETIIIDANIIIRYLINDHSILSPRAKSFFTKAQNEEIKIYLDEVVMAEVVWTLSSFYKIKRVDLVDRLEKLISQDWIINPKKGLILEALHLYASSNLDYIDCWIFTINRFLNFNLETFDKDLKLKSAKTS